MQDVEILIKDLTNNSSYVFSLHRNEKLSSLKEAVKSKSNIHLEDHHLSWFKTGIDKNDSHKQALIDDFLAGDKLIQFIAKPKNTPKKVTFGENKKHYYPNNLQKNNSTKTSFIQVKIKN